MLIQETSDNSKLDSLAVPTIGHNILIFRVHTFISMHLELKSVNKI